MSVLATPGRSSSSTWPSASRPEQHQLEHGALADDGPLELVERWRRPGRRWRPASARGAVASQLLQGGAPGRRQSRLVRLAVEGGPQRRGRRRAAARAGVAVVEVDAVAVGQAGGGDAAARSAQGRRAPRRRCARPPTPWPGPRRRGGRGRSASSGGARRHAGRLERRRRRRPASAAGCASHQGHGHAGGEGEQGHPERRWSGAGGSATVIDEARRPRRAAANLSVRARSSWPAAAAGQAGEVVAGGQKASMAVPACRAAATGGR